MKKVLIITYYWPPAGGPGVQRWLKFVKYLRDFDIEPVVYIPENPHYPLQDLSLNNEIPNGITLLKSPIKEPYFLAKIFSKKKTKEISSGIINTKKPSILEKLFLWIRGNVFIPDARIFWVKPSVTYLTKYLEEKNIDTIITSGPPHSLHLIGLQLQKKLAIKWIADFRDPWTSIGYHHKLRLTNSSKKKHERLEAKVLQSADIILVTSPTTKKQFQVLTDKPIEVITNGFDKEIVTSKYLDTKFTISHIGSLLSERNPEFLWRILFQLIEENKDFAKDFELQLAGVVSEEVLTSLRLFGIDKNVRKLGYITHKEALFLQQKSQVLLLIEIDSIETRAIIPGKIFEYMAANRPILAIGPRESDMEEIIKSTKTGCFFDYNKEVELKETLLNWYDAFKKNKLFLNSVGVEAYSRKNLTEKLSLVLKDSFQQNLNSRNLKKHTP
ncbi:MAG: glycosyl transferase family 1 [Bacteroidetes bacterium HGW-Bacteroidetes-2]|jgi:hypothetical protein|nr:MAG: glycosyl transferase family 1 [Bacteroidetes bacterium HGW-Bacteroidetes-2]